ncbi:hypothetical protein SMICM17S_02143 [Streptomyces microflavus]
MVEGKPAVIGCPVPPREVGSRECRKGASSGCAVICSQPRPSIRETQLRLAGAQLGDGGGEALHPLPGRERRQQVGQRAAAVRGDGRGVEGERDRVLPGGLGHHRPDAAVAAVASERDWAKARVCRTASGPSPASLTRRLRSSAVELPV